MMARQIAARGRLCAGAGGVVSATGDGSEALDGLKVALLSNRLGRAL
jgi:hypothetical protein